MFSKLKFYSFSKYPFHPQHPRSVSIVSPSFQGQYMCDHRHYIFEPHGCQLDPDSYSYHATLSSVLERVRNHMEPDQEKSMVDAVVPEHRVRAMSLLSNRPYE